MITFRHFRSRVKLPPGKDKYGRPVEDRTVYDVDGSITAACEIIDEDGGTKIRVGFSCANPMDAGDYRAIRARGLAQSRVKSSSIVLPVNRTDDGKLMITETVRDYLRTVAKMDKPETHLGFPEYNGREAKSQFRVWFPMFVDKALK